MKRQMLVLALSWIFTLPWAVSQTETTAPTSPSIVAASAPTAVPPLVPFVGSALDPQGKPLANPASITFLVYANEIGGEPLFAESQSVAIDSTGHYKVQLGATLANGLPQNLFSTGEARWLEVQIGGQNPQARVLIASVPYALKAADAETIGGLPPSAFVRAAPTNGSSSTVSQTSAKSNSASHPDVSGTGATGYIPLWTNSTGGLGNSAIFQSAGQNIGIGSTASSWKFTVKSSGSAILGWATGTSGLTSGVSGESSSPTGTGVIGEVFSNGVNFGVQGTTASETNSAAGVFGNATSATGSTVGVKGYSQSSVGSGVFGLASSTSGANFGVLGSTHSPDGVGVYALGYRSSAEGVLVPNRPLGAWGDTGATGGAIGVLGTADDGIGMVAANNSPTGYATLGALSNESANKHGQVFVVQNIPFKSSCVIDASGNLLCTGSKSAAVPLADGRRVALYAVEAPENWFEDAGSGKLSNGMATVSLDPTFAETVNAAIEYHVFLTPQAECEGLYVGKKTPDGFEVRELHGGHSNVSFDYRIMARRKGYEAVRLGDVTEEMSPLVLGSSKQ